MSTSAAPSCSSDASSMSSIAVTLSTAPKRPGTTMSKASFHVGSSV